MDFSFCCLFFPSPFDSIRIQFSTWELLYFTHTRIDVGTPRRYLPILPLQAFFSIFLPLKMFEQRSENEFSVCAYVCAWNDWEKVNKSAYHIPRISPLLLFWGCNILVDAFSTCTCKWVVISGVGRREYSLSICVLYRYRSIQKYKYMFALHTNL